MRLRIAAIALTAFFIGPAAQPDQQPPCTQFQLLPITLREHPDDRVRAAFVRVLKRARLPVGSFALCEYDGKIAQMLPVYRLHGANTYELALPRYVSFFSPLELDGLLAHEAGHVPLWNDRARGVSLEMRADKQGEHWVGTIPMLAMLGALHRNVNQFPEPLRPYASAELKMRAAALLVAH